MSLRRDLKPLKLVSQLQTAETVSAVSSLDAVTRCHTTRSRPSLLVASRVFNPNQRSLSLSPSLALSLSLVQHPSASSRRSEEAPTLRLTARSGALQAPVRPCNCRQLAATWHRASGESRCRTKTSFAFEHGGLTPTGASVCVCGCAQRLQKRAQASHGFERGALTLTARDHYIFRKQHI